MHVRDRIQLIELSVPSCVGYVNTAPTLMEQLGGKTAYLANRVLCNAMLFYTCIIDRYKCR